MTGADDETMTPGEAQWILGGLALQAGLCPRCRCVLTYSARDSVSDIFVQYCDRCYRDWYLDRDTGRSLGWWLTPAGWYYSDQGAITWRETKGR